MTEKVAKAAEGSHAGSVPTIREVTPQDAPALLAIYAPYVEQTAVTFEYDVPTVAEFRARIETTLAQGYPWLVALDEASSPCGFAYAGPFKDRPAYQWSVETSIYVNWDRRGLGMGRALHDALENLLRANGFLNLNACIAYIEPEDEYLSLASVRFHQKLGYTKVAHFHQCGSKFGHWYDMIWMEKAIGNHTTPCPPPPRRNRE